MDYKTQSRPLWSMEPVSGEAEEEDAVGGLKAAALRRRIAERRARRSESGTEGSGAEADALGGLPGGRSSKAKHSHAASLSTKDVVAPEWCQNPDGLPIQAPLNKHLGFNWYVEWNAPSTMNGYIIQKITNHYSETHLAATHPVTNDQPQHRPGERSTPGDLNTTYYEAWTVDGGAVNPKVGNLHDLYTMIVPPGGSQGAWSKKGEVYFVPYSQAELDNPDLVDQALSAHGFEAGRVRQAGMLRSNTSAGGFHLGSAIMHRHAQGTWHFNDDRCKHTGTAG